MHKTGTILKMAVIPIVVSIVLIMTAPILLLSQARKEEPKMNWEIWQKNMARLVQSTGGFPQCSTSAVLDILRELCESSSDKWEDRESEKGDEKGGAQAEVKDELATKEVLFSCEYSPTLMTVSWRPLQTPEADLACEDPGDQTMAHGPGFVFDSAGKIKSMEFTTADNRRETLPYRNCKAKANTAAKHRALASTGGSDTLEEFLKSVGRAKNDPNDYMTANMFCLTYDSSPAWKPWRRRYAK